MRSYGPDDRPPSYPRIGSLRASTNCCQRLRNYFTGPREHASDPSFMEASSEEKTTNPEQQKRILARKQAMADADPETEEFLTEHDPSFQQLTQEERNAADILLEQEQLERLILSSFDQAKQPPGGRGGMAIPQAPKRSLTVYGNDAGTHKKSADGGADTSAVNSFGLFLFWNVLIGIFYGCNEIIAREWIDNYVSTDDLFPIKPIHFPLEQRDFVVRCCMATELQRRGKLAEQAGPMGSVAILLGAHHDLMSQLHNEFWRAKCINNYKEQTIRETFLYSSGGAWSSVNHNVSNSATPQSTPCMLFETTTGDHSYRTIYTRKGEQVAVEHTFHFMHVAHLSGHQLKKLMAKSYAGVWGQIVGTETFNHKFKEIYVDLDKVEMLTDNFELLKDLSPMTYLTDGDYEEFAFIPQPLPSTGELCKKCMMDGCGQSCHQYGSLHFSRDQKRPLMLRTYKSVP